MSYLIRSRDVRECSDEDLGRSYVVDAGRHMQRCPPFFPDFTTLRGSIVNEMIELDDEPVHVANWLLLLYPHL